LYIRDQKLMTSVIQIGGKGLWKCKFTLHKAWSSKGSKKWRRMKSWHGILSASLAYG
jgi:hypothetical protein